MHITYFSTPHSKHREQTVIDILREHLPVKGLVYHLCQFQLAVRKDNIAFNMQNYNENDL